MTRVTVLGSWKTSKSRITFLCWISSMISISRSMSFMSSTLDLSITFSATHSGTLLWSGPQVRPAVRRVPLKTSAKLPDPSRSFFLSYL